MRIRTMQRSIRSTVVVLAVTVGHQTNYLAAGNHAADGRRR